MSIGVAAILGFSSARQLLFPLPLTLGYRVVGVAGTSRFPSGSAIMCIFRWVETGRERCACISTTSSPCWWQACGMASSWMFVIWGALHGFGLVVHKFFSRQLGISIPRTLVGNSLSWLITYFIYMLCMVVLLCQGFGCVGEDV